eukprot:4858757-Prymnesium_polylepis.3
MASRSGCAQTGPGWARDGVGLGAHDVRVRAPRLQAASVEHRRGEQVVLARFEDRVAAPRHRRRVVKAVRPAGGQNRELVVVCALPAAIALARPVNARAVE